MELTTAKAREMPIEDIVRRIRRAAAMQRDHLAITHDHGCDLITMLCTRGDEIADAIEFMTRKEFEQVG